MNQTPAQFLAQFILEQIAAQPVERSIKLYRAYAIESKDLAIQKACRDLASELEAAQQHCEQLVYRLNK